MFPNEKFSGAVIVYYGKMGINSSKVGPLDLLLNTTPSTKDSHGAQPPLPLLTAHHLLKSPTNDLFSFHVLFVPFHFKLFCSFSSLRSHSVKKGNTSLFKGGL